VGRKKKDVFKTLFDSGSSDLWFVSNQCRSSFCKDKTFYKITQNLNDAPYVRVKYDAGFITGHVIGDDFRVGDLKITDQTFIAADSADISVQGRSSILFIIE
jgi:hypothetical protein